MARLLPSSNLDYTFDNWQDEYVNSDTASDSSASFDSVSESDLGLSLDSDNISD